MLGYFLSLGYSPGTTTTLADFRAKLNGELGVIFDACVWGMK